MKHAVSKLYTFTHVTLRGDIYHISHMSVRMYLSIYICRKVLMYVFMQLCVYVCLCVCLFVCVSVTKVANGFNSQMKNVRD